MLSDLRCPSGTTETVEHREASLADHRCEDETGKAQGIVWTTEDGEVRVLGAYRDGVPHGVTRVWDETGNLFSEMEHRNGDPVRLQTWYENGQLAEEWQYEDPVTAEVWKWDEHGKLTDRLSWRNGDIEGTWTKWWPSGRIRRRAEWRAGRLDGPFAEWFENGNLRAQGTFAEGSKVGNWHYWTLDGVETAAAAREE